jgi:hypothetical protein
VNDINIHGLCQLGPFVDSSGRRTLPFQEVNDITNNVCVPLDPFVDSAGRRILLIQEVNDITINGFVSRWNLLLTMVEAGLIQEVDDITF